MKNEERHLDAFLSVIEKKIVAASDFKCEVVIVDTGSTDDSLKIIEKYKETANIKLCHFEWCKDFSAARNYSLSQASFDNVLVLDCDEYIKEIDISGLQQMIRQYPDGVGMITRNNYYSSQEMENCYIDEVERFFNRKNYAYEGIIHEQVRKVDRNDSEKSDSNYARIRIPIVVDHVGYKESENDTKQKIERNRTLLLEALEQNKEDPYLYFQLGQCYQMDKDAEKACEYFGKGLEFDVDPAAKYVQLMVNGYGYALLDTMRYEEALSFTSLYEVFGNTADFVTLMGLIYLRNGLVDSAIAEFEKALTFEKADNEGANSFVPAYNLGCIYEVLENYEKAKLYYEKCGNFAKAKERLAQLPKDLTG